jgi:DNA-binding transcriptional LysR family regulator
LQVHGHSFAWSERDPYCIVRAGRDKLTVTQFTCSRESKISRQFDYLDDLEAFVAVAERASFTAGAVALSSTPSVLSRAVTRLENRLGTQLLRRTTRQVTLTEAGRQYLEQARAAFAMLGDAEREMQGLAEGLTGRIRMSVPTTWGHHRAPPLLARFTHTHPDVQVELNITNRNVDLVAEGFDLAVRLGHFPDSGLVARKLADEVLCLVASPAYLQRAGMPERLADLERHRCLPFILPRTGRVAPWLFREGDADVEWTAAPTVCVSDDVLGVVSLAVAGAGIAQSYDFIVREQLAQGRLIELLPQLRGRSRPFSVVYAPHRRQSAATRTLIRMLTEA